MHAPGFGPSPGSIQASYLGFPGTTGADFIDYVIADPIVAPFDQQPCFTEKVVHLPDCYQPNDRTRKVATRIPTREEFGFRRGLRLLLLQHVLEDDAYSIRCLDAAVKAIPGSVLWLLRDNTDTEAHLREEAAARGPSGASRLCRPLGARRASGAPSAGRPVPGHVALQCPHDGKRWGRCGPACRC